MSVCTMAIVAAKKAVATPTTAISADASGACRYIADMRATR